MISSLLFALRFLLFCVVVAVIGLFVSYVRDFGIFGYFGKKK